MLWSDFSGPHSIGVHRFSNNPTRIQMGKWLEWVRVHCSSPTSLLLIICINSWFETLLKHIIMVYRMSFHQQSTIQLNKSSKMFFFLQLINWIITESIKLFVVTGTFWVCQDDVNVGLFCFFVHSLSIIFDWKRKRRKEKKKKTNHWIFMERNNYLYTQSHTGSV